jgi:hypothetical protein
LEKYDVIKNGIANEAKAYVNKFSDEKFREDFAYFLKRQNIVKEIN